MISSPFGLGFLLLLALLFVVFVILIEVRILAYAYRKIGVRPRYVVAVMLLSLIGSYVNIPLYRVRVSSVKPPEQVWMFGRVYVVPPATQRSTSVVAINVGGGLIPILLSLYLAVKTRMFARMAVGVLIVALVVHSLARIVPGVGIAVPMVIPPLVAAGVALLLAFRRAPPVAYVAGSMGTLLGADLWNLGRIAELGAPLVSIGGAGTFDGIFLTGIIAGLLA
ncbi:MAG: hypothetical protein DMD81_15165 [Candidatus Rokuibacteriota bacterium]|nr:MAG: hypothetical protein DMD81_15165 [Candidatus Rokubacteria bacterium]